MAYMTDENGNYKRTVRCGYCYQMGHNKGSCPERKKDLAASIEKTKARLKEDDYPVGDDWSRRNDQRRLENYTEQLNKMLNKGKNRKCSYCGEGGHNRKTCQERKNDIVDAASVLTNYRKKLLSKMKDVGLGVGAIVRTQVRTQDDTVSALGLVENIVWENVTHDSMFRAGDWRPSPPNIVSIRVLGDYTNRWGEKVGKQLNTVPVDVANVDGDVLDPDRMDRIHSGYPALQMVSGVDNVVAPAKFLWPETINNLAKVHVDERR